MRSGCDTCHSVKARFLGELCEVVWRLVIIGFLELLTAHKEAVFVHQGGVLFDLALVLVAAVVFVNSGGTILFGIENAIVVGIVVSQPLGNVSVLKLLRIQQQVVVLVDVEEVDNGTVEEDIFVHIVKPVIHTMQAFEVVFLNEFFD